MLHEVFLCEREMGKRSQNKIMRLLEFAGQYAIILSEMLVEF